jgi:Ca2+/Na+ antiporter
LQDVAAATFMSVATSAPELFVNIIGTFVTESDIGIGTVVGSSLFNTLGVASLGGLAASKVHHTRRHPKQNH